jgi:hypothetical protein
LRLEVSVSEIERARRCHYLVRKTTLAEQDDDPDLENTTPAERLGMMWQLTLDAWAFAGESLAESRLPRHLVRIRRMGRKP